MTGPALYHPTLEEKERELRLYLVVRSDLRLTRAALVELSGQATWRTLKAAMSDTPERFAGYSAAAQPKIGVRVKSQGHLERANREALAAGLASTIIEVAPGVPAIVGIGPVARPELPSFVAGLQMLGDSQAPEPQVFSSRHSPERPALWILVREDAGIPYGKLVPQAGHGAWGTLFHALRTAPARIEAWDHSSGNRSPEHEGASIAETRSLPGIAALSVADLPTMERCFEAARKSGLPAAFITDAGRTVYQGQPTPTVVGIGPCLASELPLMVAQLTGL